MSRLRDKLVEQYAQHFSRVNRTIDPTGITINQEREMEQFYRPLLKKLPVGSKILDLGCGTGFLISWLHKQPNIKVVGVDSSETQIMVARNYLPGIDLYCEDGLEFLKKHPGEFAGITCLDVVEHIPGDDLLLEWFETVRQALLPGGFFFIRTPNAANITGTYSKYIDMTHERIYTRTSLSQVLEAAGFQKLRVVPITGVSFNARLRTRIEHILHKAIFRICNRGEENVFTSNICMVALK